MSTDSSTATDVDLLMRLSTCPLSRLLLLQLTAPLIETPSFLCQLDRVNLSRVVALSRGLPIVDGAGAPLSTSALNLAVSASCTVGSNTVTTSDHWDPSWCRTRFVTDEQLTSMQHVSRQIITHSHQGLSS